MLGYLDLTGWSLARENHKKTLVLLTIATTLIMLYNGCGDGFRSAMHEGILPSTLPGGGGTASALIKKGEDLYSRNCAGCHSAIATSSVPDFSSGRIIYAVTSVGAMTYLKSIISQADADALSAALKFHRGAASGFQGGSGLEFACGEPNSRGANIKNFDRLKKPEYINVLIALLGAPTVADSTIKAHLAEINEDNIAVDFTSLNQSHHLSFFPAQFKIAKRAADILAGNATLRGQVLGACAGGASIDSACAQSVISNFGLRVHRRPLTAAEQSSYLALYNKIYAASGNSSIQAMKGIVTRFLASPPMSFQVELGGDVLGNRRRLTDYEVASRLAFRLTGAPPDKTLLDAAGQGQLQTLAQVRAQIQRLINAGAARNKTKEFVRYYAGVERMSPPNAAIAQNLGISMTGLVEEMKEETINFADHVINTKKGGYADLMLSDEVFPLSDRMARILETGVTQPGVPVRTNRNHRGLVLRPSMLSADTPRTDIIHRGLGIRRQFMCGLGSGQQPDPSALAAAAQGIDFDNLTNREGISKMTGRPQCITCHAIFNPLAYTLEGHNQLGMIRTSEVIVSATGQVVKTFAIDTSVGRSYIDRDNDTALRDAGDMVEKFASSREARACFVARSLSYYYFKNYNSSDDGCTLTEGLNAVQSNQPVHKVIEAIVGSEDIFWKGN